MFTSSSNILRNSHLLGTQATQTVSSSLSFLVALFTRQILSSTSFPRISAGQGWSQNRVKRGQPCHSENLAAHKGALLFPWRQARLICGLKALPPVSHW